MLAPLVNRTAELGRLNDAWQRAGEGSPQLLVVWGRRRVGKTFLLSHFAQGRRAVFFGATQQAEAVELRRLTETIRRDLGDQAGHLAGGGFPSWEAALQFLSALATERPLLVILDEVPYLARSTPGFASIVQVVWDHLRPGSKLVLVLTGSAVGVMEEIMGAGGALRGRPTLSLPLAPVDLIAAGEFLPALPAADLLQAYAACGGYPLHLRQWDAGVSTRENLRRLAFAPGGVLLEDAEGMLREELSPTGGYAQILAAIGRGRTRFSHIAGEVGQRIDHALDVLIKTAFVSKVLPVGAPRGARATYEIFDPYLRFWFQVLYTEAALIAGGQGDAVLERALPRWQTHVGFVFEEQARAHARRLVQRGELPPDLVVGRWWPGRGASVEIDVLGLRGSRTALLGEARWQSAPLGRRDLESLHRKVPFVLDPVDDPTLVLWGRGGVTPDVRRAGAIGFSIDDIVV
jgi:hypothetical protein